MTSAPSLLMFTDAYRCLPSAFGTALTQPSICGGHVFQDFFVVILIAVRNTPPQKKTSCIFLYMHKAVWSNCLGFSQDSKILFQTLVSAGGSPTGPSGPGMPGSVQHWPAYFQNLESCCLSKWNSVGVQNHWFTSVER